MTAGPAAVRLRRRLRLGPRLALAFAAPAAAAVLGCGVVAYLGTRAVLEEELGRRLCALAAVAAATVPLDLASTLEPGDDDTRTAQNVRRRLQAVHVEGSAARVLLVDGERLVRADSSGRLVIGTEVPRLRFDAVELERAQGGPPQASVLFSGPDGREYKSCYARVHGDGPLMFTVVEGAADLFDNLQALAWLFAVLCLVATGLIGVVAVVVGRQLGTPLHKLSADARAMGDGALGLPVVATTDDEVGDVARALEEMRQRLKARDEEQQMMLAGIAHEVRNPLGGMELYAGILEESVAELPAETPAALREELKGAVARVRQELRYLATVVNEFLGFARDHPPQRQSLDVAGLLADLKEVVRPDAQARGVELVVHPTVPAGLQALVDHGQVRGAVLNLLQNAVQASPAGQKVELSAQERDGVLTVVVTDHGPGMSRESLERALTPFFTTKEKGTGLGLPLAVKIARAHGGRLQLESAPGEGCRAMLVIPGVRASA